MLKKTLAIIGGSGVLGSAILNPLKKTRWQTINFDYTESKLAKRNIIIKREIPIESQISEIHKTISKLDDEFDAVISTAGGIAGQIKISEPKFFAEYAQKYKENVESALLRIFFSLIM